MAIRKTDSTFYIDEITESNLVAIYSIEKECFSNPWPLESFHFCLNDPAADCWMIRTKTEIAGYLVGLETKASYLIANMAISKHQRQKGLASRLIKFALEEIILRDIPHVLLDVRESNHEAIGLYRKHGFCALGKREDYYSHPAEDSIVMLKDIGLLRNRVES